MKQISFILFLFILTACVEGDKVIIDQGQVLNSDNTVDSIEFNSESDNNQSSFQTIKNENKSSEIIKKYVGLCEEGEFNFIPNGDFEKPLINKNWKILNKDDDQTLAWEVNWNSKKPCGKNQVSPRLEIQKNGNNQILELDSDCQGNNQFNMTYPVKKEKTKIKINQKISNLPYGSIMKLKFDVKKRNSLVTEDLLVKIGKYKNIFKNEDLSFNWQTKELIFELNDKKLDENDDLNLIFSAKGGKSDSFGLQMDNIKLLILNNCFLEKKKVCTEAHSVVDYNPQGSFTQTRQNPAFSFGEPDGEPYSGDVKFVSLGYGGSITYKFRPRVKNINGYDLRVFETSGGNKNFNQYPEKAKVYASNNGTDWTFLNDIKNDNGNPNFGMIELGTIKSAKYIKIVDDTDQSLIKNGDGFDIDAIQCLNEDHTEERRKLFYADKTNFYVYNLKNLKNKLRLKERFSFNEGASHIALSLNKKYLTYVEEKSKDLFIYDLKLNLNKYILNTGLPKVTQVSYSGSGKLYLADMNLDKVFLVDIENKNLLDLGKVYLNNKAINLSGGDLSFSKDYMYILSQDNGGRLYKVIKNNNRLEVDEIVLDNLGKVSGLAVFDDNHFLMSLLNENYMLEYKDGNLKEKQLKGDLLNQGGGADLAINPLESMNSNF